MELRILNRRVSQIGDLENAASCMPLSIPHRTTRIGLTYWISRFDDVDGPKIRGSLLANAGTNSGMLPEFNGCALRSPQVLSS